VHIHREASTRAHTHAACVFLGRLLPPAPSTVVRAHPFTTPTSGNTSLYGEAPCAAAACACGACDPSPAANRPASSPRRCGRCGSCCAAPSGRRPARVAGVFTSLATGSSAATCPAGGVRREAPCIVPRTSCS
jgi:hypothetical protein